MKQRLVVAWFMVGVLTGATLAWIVYYESGVTWVEGYTQSVYDQGYADGLQRLGGLE